MNRKANTMYTLENAPLNPDTLESLKLIVNSIRFPNEEPSTNSSSSRSAK